MVSGIEPIRIVPVEHIPGLQFDNSGTLMAANMYIEMDESFSYNDAKESDYIFGEILYYNENSRLMYFFWKKPMLWPENDCDIYEWIAEIESVVNDEL